MYQFISKYWRIQVMLWWLRIFNIFIFIFLRPTINSLNNRYQISSFILFFFLTKTFPSIGFFYILLDFILCFYFLSWKWQIFLSSDHIACVKSTHGISNSVNPMRIFIVFQCADADGLSSWQNRTACIPMNEREDHDGKQAASSGCGSMLEGEVCGNELFFLFSRSWAHVCCLWAADWQELNSVEAGSTHPPGSSVRSTSLRLSSQLCI